MKKASFARIQASKFSLLPSLPVRKKISLQASVRLAVGSTKELEDHSQTVLRVSSAKMLGSFPSQEPATFVWSPLLVALKVLTLTKRSASVLVKSSVNSSASLPQSETRLTIVPATPLKSMVISMLIPREPTASQEPRTTSKSIVKTLAPTVKAECLIMILAPATR